MTRQLLFFVAHPVAGDVKANVGRALRWYRWLVVTQPSVLYTLPWIPDVMVFDDSVPAEREAGMRRNFQILERCDGLVLVGGILSRGMSAELDHAKSMGLTVVDYLPMGFDPPEAR